MPTPQDPSSPSFRASPAYGECFPSSEKVYTEVVHADSGRLLHVPARRVHLTGGSGMLDVPDTSGPQVSGARGSGELAN